MVCRGAPRDLGLDQGLRVRAALREALGPAGPRAALASLWRRGPNRGPLNRLDRQLRRFFPHLAERLGGLARGARVPREGLVALLAEGAASAAPGPSALVAAAPERSGAGALLARVQPAPSAGPRCVVLRESHPDNDYRSVELVEAGGVAALLGVNQHGLAAAVGAATPAREADGCAAPASLLVQDCLQRFDAVEKAVEWCMRRPAGGRASILLADASGVLAAVDVDGDARRVRAPADGVLTASAADADRALEKALAARAHLHADALWAALAAGAGTGPAALRVLADPARRCLRVLAPGDAAPRELLAGSPEASRSS